MQQEPQDLTTTEILNEVAASEARDGCADRDRLQDLNLELLGRTNKTAAMLVTEREATAERTLDALIAHAAEQVEAGVLQDNVRDALVNVGASPELAAHLVTLAAHKIAEG